MPYCTQSKHINSTERIHFGNLRLRLIVKKQLQKSRPNAGNWCSEVHHPSPRGV